MVFIKTSSQLEQYLISKRESLFILIMGDFSSVSNPKIAKSSHTQNCSYCKLIKIVSRSIKVTQDEESRIMNMILYHYDILYAENFGLEVNLVLVRRQDSWSKLFHER